MSDYCCKQTERETKESGQYNREVLSPWAPLPSGGDAVEAFSSEMLAG